MIDMPKRPSWEARLEAACRTVQHLVKQGLAQESEAAKLATDIAAVCEHRDDVDGYQLAVELQRHHNWACDLELANELDVHSSHLREEYLRELREFQRKHNVQPPLPDEAMVKTPRGRGRIVGVFDRRPMSYAVEVFTSDITAERFVFYWDEVEPG